MMNAQQILTTMQTLAAIETLNAKVKESEDTIQTLIQQVDRLTRINQQQQQSLDNLVKKMQCPTCTQYLDSKRDGDTIEGRQCNHVFLSRCIGIAQ